jgi:Tfp pilus assembly protein PilO
MSERTHDRPYATGQRSRVRAHLERLRHSRRRSALGPAEVAGLVGAAVILLAAVFAYFSFLVPAQLRLQQATVQRAELQNAFKQSSEGLKLNTDKQTAVQEISQSLTDFEGNTLSSRGEGRVALYDELNGLIRTNNLRNTSGPTYVPLDALGEDGKAVSAASTRTGNAKWQSLYPGIGVSLTVEGQYGNLRRFIRDIESNKHFLIINSVQLERATDVEAPGEVTGAVAPTGVAPTGVAPTGVAPAGAAPIVTAPKGNLVSLQLDLATYFRRESTEANPQSGSGPR